MTADPETAILDTTLTDEVARPLMAKPLSQYREERYLTVREFAGLLGITQQTYFRLVQGKTRAHPTTMRRIAEKLGVHPSEISEFVRRRE